jgi:hypothetical protein
MPFGSTITITVNAVANVLNRINQDQYGSEYYLVNPGVDSYRLKIRHSIVAAGKDGVQYDRHNWEVVRTVFPSGTVPQFEERMYGVYQVPSNYDATGALNNVLGVMDYFRGTSITTDIMKWLN